MAKTSEQVKQKGRARRTRLGADNKTLKSVKNWYPVSNEKTHFKRASKAPRAARLRKDIQPGQVLILLSGRFRGRRVVFLRTLPSGLLLVTGPYKVNGVPLKRVNQAYVIPTRTRVTLGTVPGVDKITDDFFTTRVSIKRESVKDFFEAPEKKRQRITEARRNAQSAVDTEVLRAVKEVPQLRDYLSNRFALSNADRPHNMLF